MKLIQTKIKVEKTAQLFFSDDWENKNSLLMAIHGYGQSAQQFINQFINIKSNIGLCAPEGLSKFYWKGFEGDVVASWMTKDNRQDEIDDYINYLLKVDENLKDKSDRVVYLGFSQGATTLFRFLKASHQTNKTVIIVGNKVPKEVYDYMLSSNHNLHLIYGNQDVFISEEQRLTHLSDLDNLGLKYTSYVLNSRHKIDDETVNTINKII